MYKKFLTIWVTLVIDHAIAVMLGMSLITIVAGYYAITRFSINSNTDDLIHQDTQWKSVYNEFNDAFPQLTNTTYVVVSGSSPSRVDDVARQLESLLRSNADQFESIYAPSNHPFFREHAFLFLDLDDLDRVISALAQAQPALTALANDHSLRGLFKLLEEGLERDEELPAGFVTTSDFLSDTIASLIKNEEPNIYWRDILLGAGQEIYHNIIIVKGRLNYGDTLPNEQIVASIRESVQRLNLSDDMVKVRLTGQTPLDHGEITSAMDGAQMGGSIALVLLVIVLVFGVRSFRVICATYMAMLVGLVWTAAYAILTVGQYNTISIAFLVMFIGLGVDFAIHLCLRYQEELADKLTDKHPNTALLTACTEAGPTISLCAITSALGFLAFVPTEYKGLADLGIISSGGMIIALFVSFTLIPAFFSLTATPVSLKPVQLSLHFSNFLLRNDRSVVTLIVLVTILSVWLAKDTYFDYSTLSLKDQQSEEMVTFKELQRDGVITDYAISILAEGSVPTITGKLSTLSTVAEVRTPNSYLPDLQGEKIALLEDASFMLASSIYGLQSNKKPGNQERIAIINSLMDTIDQTLMTHIPDLDSDQHSSLDRLKGALKQLINHSASQQLALQLEDGVVDAVMEELAWLKLALQVDPILFDDLPAQLKSRLITADGRIHISVLPEEDLVSVETLEQFVNEVTSIAPNATGRPVVELGIGQIVIDSFIQALIYASVSILLLLYLSLRNVVDTLLVFVPLSVAAMMTFATTVVADLPLNMANVVVVPLIFGLGVDNGIHVVRRFHEGNDLTQLVRSSTPRAVLLSTLTTIGTFGSLSFSSHQGIYSIGILLSCALTFQLILTLFALPALLHVFAHDMTKPVE